MQKPKQINFSDGRRINFYYDTQGQKLKQTTSIGDETHYVTKAIYQRKNAVTLLYQISQAEGRELPFGSAFVQEYEYRDLVGNLRLSFKDATIGNPAIRNAPTIVQAVEYDPWGLELNGLGYESTSSPSKFKFSGKETISDFSLGWIDFGARMYDRQIGRWSAIDPLAEKNHFESSYVFVHNNPLKYIDPDGRDAILVAFPDYKISTPVGKVSNLGHAGVLLIDNKTGLTKYYEYGRYDSEGKGLVRSVSVSNVKIGKDGKPTEQSLQKVLGQISKKSGQNGRIEGAYIESDNFEAMNSYAKEKMAENSDPNREPYSLRNNNCGTFGCDVVNQDPNVAKSSPSIFDPRPNSIIKEYQGEYGKVQYNPKTGGSVETVDKSRYQEVLDKMKKYFNQ